MNKLIIISVLIGMTGCSGYEVVHVCDNNRLYYQAVMPWQEKPESCFPEHGSSHITDDQCLAMLNLVAKHYDRPEVVAPVSCNK